MRASASVALALGLLLPACAAIPAPPIPAPGLPRTVSDEGYGYDDSEFDFGGSRGEYSREGGYGAIALLYSFEQFDSFPITFMGTPVSTTVDDSLGTAVRGGYRVSEEFAVELSIERALTYEVTARLPVFGKATLDLEMLTIWAQGKVYACGGSVQPYGVVGVGWWDAELENLDDSGVGLRAGAGVDFWLDRSGDSALFLEATFNTGAEIEGVDLDHFDVMAGLVFRF
jgi:hypothetical protein